MVATQPATPGILSAISSWFSPESKRSARVAFNGSKITDSIYDLRPLVEQVEDFSVEIIFLHGLQRDMHNVEDAFCMTWISDTDPPTCWPATLLPRLFPEARLLSVKYDGAAKGTNAKGRDDIDKVAQTLVMDLIQTNRPFGAGVGQTRAPVIFVTHCIGALVAQKILLEVDRQLSYRPNDLKLKNFWNNFAGVVYYSPPLEASEHLATATEYMDTKGPLMKLLQILAKDSTRIGQDFSCLLAAERFEPKPSTLAIYEWLSTTRDVFDGQVEVGVSAGFGERYVTVKGDHFSVAQPADQTSDSFKHLAKFVQEVVRSHVFARPRNRGETPGISPLKRQLDKTIIGGESGQLVEQVDVGVLNHSGDSSNKRSCQTVTSTSRRDTRLPVDLVTKTTSCEKSSALTFFNSYDETYRLQFGVTYSR
ncbi:hypothetical protein R1sor_025681 [Riccia sorocarpa]|uniref:Uncharacterized protein n=1 Tax=Riccia sorocarpa TaxID=122646 RepID=A0ABD3G9A1_9MARC